jgi:hypothetical protein
MSETNSNFDKKRFMPGRFIFFPLLFIGAGLIMGAVVMWLWNAILPSVMGVGILSYWHAVGLLLLCRILFGGFRGGGSHWGKHNNGFGGSRPHMRQRWMQMNEEERTRFKEQWRERCRKRGSN